MFASFTSILSPALKEKLGIGTKKSQEPVLVTSRPLSPLNRSNRTLSTPLSHSLQCEVQSPGFASRLTTMVRRRAQDSPQYSRAGSLPVVRLSRLSPPRLTARSSAKFGRAAGRSPATLRIAPSEPFSPFKRFGGSLERMAGAGLHRRGEEQGTDPRQVIAVLAELSGKRTRRPSDESVGEGSKRARRDSSSSLGSSLSMEMPPLFSNGVVGQTTSHLVSREADLSLGSLLSRNQSLFGHPGGHPGGHPSLPLSSMSHLSQTLAQSVVTAHAQSQTNGQQRNNSSGGRLHQVAGPDLSRAVAAELEASLSSSRCMLKRVREETLTDSEGEEDTTLVEPTPKRSNVFRSPDKTSEKKRRRKSSGSEPSSGRKGSLVSSSPPEEAAGPAVPGPGPERSSLTGIFPPSPAEVLGTSVRKVPKQQLLGAKEIQGERELQRKRLTKMLNIFPDQQEATRRAEEASREPPAALKPGGFPFTIGEERPSGSEQPPAATTEAGGFPFTFGAKVTSATTTTVTSAMPVPAGLGQSKKPDTSVTFKLPAEFGGAKETAAVSSTVTIPGPVVTEAAKPAAGPSFNATSAVTVTDGPKTNEAPPAFSFGLARPTTTTTTAAGAFEPGTAATSGTPKPTFSFSGAGTTTTTTAVASSSFSFPKPPTTPAKPSPVKADLVDTSSMQSLPDLPPPAYSAIPATKAATPPSTAAVKPFSFGAGATATSAALEGPKLVGGTGMFSFGSTTATTSAAPSATTTAAAPSFGTTATSTFGFGATGAPAVPGAAFTFGAKATASTAAATPTFGTAPATTAASAAPSFSFGTSAPTAGPAPAAAASPFQFGAAATATASAPSSKPVEQPKAAFSFGPSAAAVPAAGAFGQPAAAPAFGSSLAQVPAQVAPASSFSFGGTTSKPATFASPATTKSASTGSVFSFGKAPAVAAAPAPAPAFNFGGAAAAPPPAAATAASPFAFGAPPVKSASSPFAFGAPAAAPAAPVPTPGVFSFGSAPLATAPAPAAQPSTGYNFGAAAATAPAPGVFSFGSAAPAPAQPGNPFGAPGAAPAPAFGAPAPAFGAPAPAFGAQPAPAPAFGGVQSPPPAGGNMFSIGAGGQNRTSATGAPSRRIATARRTRK